MSGTPVVSDSPTQTRAARPLAMARVTAMPSSHRCEASDATITLKDFTQVVSVRSPPSTSPPSPTGHVDDERSSTPDLVQSSDSEASAETLFPKPIPSVKTGRNATLGTFAAAVLQFNSMSSQPDLSEPLEVLETTGGNEHDYNRQLANCFAITANRNQAARAKVATDLDLGSRFCDGGVEYMKCDMQRSITTLRQAAGDLQPNSTPTHCAGDGSVALVSVPDSEASEGSHREKVGRDGIRRPDMVIYGIKEFAGSQLTTVLLTAEHKYTVEQEKVCLAQGMAQLVSAQQTFGTYRSYCLSGPWFTRMVQLGPKLVAIDATEDLASEFGARVCNIGDLFLAMDTGPKHLSPSSIAQSHDQERFIVFMKHAIANLLEKDIECRRLTVPPEVTDRAQRLLKAKQSFLRTSPQFEPIAAEMKSKVKRYLATQAAQASAPSVAQSASTHDDDDARENRSGDGGSKRGGDSSRGGSSDSNLDSNNSGADDADGRATSNHNANEDADAYDDADTYNDVDAYDDSSAPVMSNQDPSIPDCAVGLPVSPAFFYNGAAPPVELTELAVLLEALKDVDIQVVTTGEMDELEELAFDCERERVSKRTRAAADCGGRQSKDMAWAAAPLVSRPTCLAAWPEELDGGC